MNKHEIKTFLDNYQPHRTRTIVIVDYGNVEKWKHGLGWEVSIQKLAKLIKLFSHGNEHLRRFYYGADYGRYEKSLHLVPWSKSVLDTAKFSHLKVVDKRVKYIHNANNLQGFSKKCDLDVEMTVDLIKLRDEYDTILLFSGDGDLISAIKYLKETYGKVCYVFGARGHVGREVQDAKSTGEVADIFYAEDFEYRLNNQYQARS